MTAPALTGTQHDDSDESCDTMAELKRKRPFRDLALLLECDKLTVSLQVFGQPSFGTDYVCERNNYPPSYSQASCTFLASLLNLGN